MTESKWPGPKGLIPEPEANAADANRYARGFLDSLLVEMRIVDAFEADLRTEILGRTYASPIMMPAFSHLNKVGRDGRTPMQEYALAAKNLNVLNWVGMEPDEEFKAIMDVNPDSVRIIKPFADHERIYAEIAFARTCGARAVGIDIDHVFGHDGCYDIVDGIPLGPVTQEDLASYVRYADIPFIAKGVLSVQDAVKCRDAGCAGLFISHHHGRIPFGMAPAAMIRPIRKELGEDILLFCDCSIDSGYDAYKALALGADAVSVGRGILRPLLAEGAEGVMKKVTKMNQELKELMGYTGIPDTASFDPSVLYSGIKRYSDEQ